MKFSRRQALQTLLLGGPLMAAGGVRLALAASYRPSLFLIGGIDSSVSAERLFSILDPIVSQNVPVGLVIDVSDPELGPTSELARLFRSLLVDYSGLVELMVHVPGIVDETPYFRMRSATNARDKFCKMLGSDAEEDFCRSGGLTLATEMSAGEVDEIIGVRASGFRNLMLLPQTPRDAGYWKLAGGVLQFYGGHPVDERLDKGVLDAALSSSSDGEEPLVLYLSLSEALSNTNDAFLLGATIGDALMLKNTSGDIDSVLPTDMHLRSGGGYGRLIGLRVEGSDSPAIDDFIEQLRKAKLPFTQVVAPDFTPPLPLPDTVVKEYCMALPSGSLDRLQVASRLAALGADCLSVGPQDLGTPREIGDTGALLVSTQTPGSGTFTGLDRYGTLHLPVTFAFNGSKKIRSAQDAKSDLLAGIGSQHDVVVAVYPEAIEDPVAGNAIVTALSELARSGESKIVSLGEFRDLVGPSEQKYDLLKASKTQLSLALGDRIEVGAAEKQKLMEDAKVAWQFIERMRNPNTGLVPGTVWKEGDSNSSYPYATMWDIGTLIMAQVSAHMLGLIDDAKLKAENERLLADFPVGTVNGLLLPQASASISGGAPEHHGYDSTDVGRLLIGLKVLDSYVDYDLGIPELIANWDLDQTILDGQLRGIQNGRFISVQDSAYAHYAARGFKLWGFDVTSPHETSDTQWDLDTELRALTFMAHNGPISSEPHVLEEVELGYSNAARTAADVLYTAQLAEHEKTGELVCVSEGPLNREPWFTYQVFQIGDEEDPWKVKTIGNLARYQTAGFQRAVEMVSSKAAFLWLAARPQGYSQVLADHIRETARFDDLGFASGVFTSTGLPTANYSDINTNGVILQSIAYIMRGRKPLLAG